MIEVLTDVISRVVDLCPKFILIEPGTQGLCVTRGQYTALPPGFHLYWPFWSRVTPYAVNRQAMSVEVVRDVEGKSVCTQLWLVYQITDLVLAASTSADWADTIDDVARITTIVDSGNLRDQIAELLEDYGIEITDFGCVEYTPRVLRLEHVGTIPLEAAISE